MNKLCPLLKQEQNPAHSERQTSTRKYLLRHTKHKLAQDSAKKKKTKKKTIKKLQAPVLKKYHKKLNQADKHKEN